jgi:hypothetical protein
MKLNIDLSDKATMPTPCCLDDVYYPGFTITSKEDIELPESGVLTATFKVVSKTTSEENGKKRYSCHVKLVEITGAKEQEVTLKTSKPKEDEYKQRESILDSLRDELAKEQED